MSIFASFTASIQDAMPHKTATLDELTAPLPVHDGEAVAFELSGETVDILVRARHRLSSLTPIRPTSRTAGAHTTLSTVRC